MVAAADRVRVTWEGTGTSSPITLGSAISSKFFAPPSSLNGETVSYLIEHQGEGVSEMEFGRGVYTHSGTTLARTSIIGSTNGGLGGSAVNFSAGVKHVSITILSSDLQGRFISTLTEGTIDGANDFLAFWDATDSGLKKVKPNNLPSAVLGMQQQIPVDLGSGDADYTLLQADGIGKRITFAGDGGNGRVILPNDIVKTGTTAPFWLVQADIDTVTGSIQIHVDDGATAIHQGSEIEGATEIDLEFPSLYFISLITNVDGTSAVYQVDWISHSQAVPSGGIATVSGTNHRLTAAQRTSQNFTVLIDNSDEDATIVVPEDAGAGDSWFLDNNSTGTITIVVAETGLWEEPVKDKDLTAPPGGSPGPVTGDRYIVGGSATGAWSGHDDEIAEWDGAAWEFTAEVSGMTTWVEDELSKYVFAAGEWGGESGNALLNGQEYRQLSGSGRVALIWIRSNPTSLEPLARLEGEPVADTVAQGDHDADGYIIKNHRAVVLTSVSGSLTSAAHSGNILVTSGNVTIPNGSGDVGFSATIVAGGAHTVTFNSDTSAAMASGDVMTVAVQSTTVIKASLVESADLVVFS